jgi:hypothetical protein
MQGNSGKFATKILIAQYDGRSEQIGQSGQDISISMSINRLNPNSNTCLQLFHDAPCFPSIRPTDGVVSQLVIVYLNLLGILYDI